MHLKQERAALQVTLQQEIRVIFLQTAKSRKENQMDCSHSQKYLEPRHQNVDWLFCVSHARFLDKIIPRVIYCIDCLPIKYLGFLI